MIPKFWVACFRTLVCVVPSCLHLRQRSRKTAVLLSVCETLGQRRLKIHVDLEKRFGKTDVGLIANRAHIGCLPGFPQEVIKCLRMLRDA